MTPLCRILRNRIQNEGPMPFSSYMAEALYHPQHGYYASPRLRTGRQGDFYTSVSVGPVFGEIMAGEFCAAWERMGQPESFTVIEAGANDGQFAADVLRWVREHRPAFLNALTYQIDEPLAQATAVQQEMLRDFASNVKHDANRSPEHGCYFANELLDAIPCSRVRFTENGWEELWLGIGEDEPFRWEVREPEGAALNQRLAWLGTDFPLGYTTEVAPAVADHMKQAASRLKRGYWFFADYGYAAADYYAPHRQTGTMRCYRGHTAHEDLLSEPGETDLTAHVDFSLAAKAAADGGCEVIGFLDQARFLTAAAADRLREMEEVEEVEAPMAGSSWQRQFQTLTHPAYLGQQFRFLVLGKNVENLPQPESLRFARKTAVDELLRETFWCPGEDS